MEWSGNFTEEEYVAFAQDISDEDMPGFVTLTSFKHASVAGCSSLTQNHPRFFREKRDDSNTGVSTTT